MTLDKTVSRLTTTIENMEMRSAKLMNGRVFAGARALYRAAGVDGKDFGKPIIAIANSFDEFLPGHVHLNKVGRLISEAIKNKVKYDAFIVLTDNDVNSGHHSQQLLETYRATVNPKAKLIVVGMTVSGTSATPTPRPTSVAIAVRWLNSMRSRGAILVIRR